MARVPYLSLEDMTARQSEVFRAIAQGARGAVRGPFKVMIHSPDLAEAVANLGLYVRFRCQVPQRLRELAIIAVSRHWRADYEWYAHAPLAEAVGISPATVAAVAEGGDCKLPEDDEDLIVRYVRTLLHEGRVGQPLYDEARQLLGEPGLVDLTALVGYYSLLALVLNAFDVEIPEGGTLPWASREKGGADE